MRRLMLLAAFALTACGGKSSEPTNPTPPPEVASNFGQPFDAVGTDPDWGLKIRGTTITLSRPNQPDIVASAPGAAIQPSEASWTAPLPDGRQMKVNIYVSACTGGNAVNYAFTAEVVLPDQSPLVGCAGPPASAARSPKR